MNAAIITTTTLSKPIAACAAGKTVHRRHFPSNMSLLAMVCRTTRAQSSHAQAEEQAAAAARLRLAGRDTDAVVASLRAAGTLTTHRAAAHMQPEISRYSC